MLFRADEILLCRRFTEAMHGDNPASLTVGPDGDHHFHILFAALGKRHLEPLGITLLLDCLDIPIYDVDAGVDRARLYTEHLACPIHVEHFEIGFRGSFSLVGMLDACYRIDGLHSA